MNASRKTEPLPWKCISPLMRTLSSLNKLSRNSVRWEMLPQKATKIYQLLSMSAGADFAAKISLAKGFQRQLFEGLWLRRPGRKLFGAI